MGRPNQYRTFDAFTPTGNGPTVDQLHPAHVVPTHQAHYKGRPAYMTTNNERTRLQRKGDR